MCTIQDDKSGQEESVRWRERERDREREQQEIKEYHMNIFVSICTRSNYLIGINTFKCGKIQDLRLDI